MRVNGRNVISSLALCGALMGCTVGTAAAPDAELFHPPAAIQAPPQGLQLSALFLPAVTFDADVDEDEKNGGILFKPDLKTGEGYSVTASSELTNVTFLTSQHRDRSSGDQADHYALLFGFHTESPIDLSGDDQFRLIPGFGAGAGLAGFDYGFAYDDELAGALHVEGGLGLGIGPNLRVTVQVGYLLYGYPGETVAHGLYGGIGGTIGF